MRAGFWVGAAAGAVGRYYGGRLGVLILAIGFVVYRVNVARENYHNSMDAMEAARQERADQGDG